MASRESGTRSAISSVGASEPEASATNRFWRAFSHFRQCLSSARCQTNATEQVRVKICNILCYRKLRNSSAWQYLPTSTQISPRARRAVLLFSERSIASQLGKDLRRCLNLGHLRERRAEALHLSPF